jgi:hypothetical protein
VLAHHAQPVPWPSFRPGDRCRSRRAPGSTWWAMFRHCTRYNSFVSHPEQVEMKLASADPPRPGRPPGPAHLSIPLDVLRAPCRHGTRPSSGPCCAPPCPHRRARGGGAGLRAWPPHRRPVFLVGSRRGAGRRGHPMGLVRSPGAVFATTPDGKGLVDPRPSRLPGRVRLRRARQRRASARGSRPGGGLRDGFGEMASGGCRAQRPSTIAWCTSTTCPRTSPLAPGPAARARHLPSDLRATPGPRDGPRSMGWPSGGRPTPAGSRQPCARRSQYRSDAVAHQAAAA